MLVALLIKTLTARQIHVPFLTVALETTESYLNDKEEARKKVKTISFHIVFHIEVNPGG